MPPTGCNSHLTGVNATLYRAYTSAAPFWSMLYCAMYYYVHFRQNQYRGSYISAEAHCRVLLPKGSYGSNRKSRTDRVGDLSPYFRYRHSQRSNKRRSQSAVRVPCEFEETAEKEVQDTSCWGFGGVPQL